GNHESKCHKKSKDAKTKDLSLEDNILAQLEKDKSALNRVEEACKIAIDGF
ncbi:12411_t:CDS:1, partial [Dentiscutata erythropus]